jgi:hypothetical protein
VRGGPDLRILNNFFLLVLKILPAAPFSEHFLGYHPTKILLSGHFPQKFRLRRRLTKSKLPGAREHLNPTLEIYKGKVGFTPKILKIFVLKTCFLPIKSHKT